MSRYPLHSPQKPSIFVARRLLAPKCIEKIHGFLLICLSALVLTACGGGGGAPENDFTILGNGGFSGGGGATGGASAGDDTTGPAVLRIGSGVGAAFVQGTAAAAETDLQSGESTTITVNIVDELGNAVTEGAIVAFSSPCSASGLATFSETPISTATGQAQTEYTAFGCDGNDVVTATLIENATTATVTLSIAPNEILAVVYQEATKTLVQIGGQDTSELTFRVLGAGGVPAPPGEDVTFSIASAPDGVTILAGRESGTTDNNGRVKTVIKSGSVQGPVSVIATHDATNTQGTSEDIIISTGVPDYSFFSLSSSGNNPPGASISDTVEVTFLIIASDQFGNNPRDGTRVSFVSPEAGNITNSCELIDGVCSVTWRSSETRPADMRVEIIAYTSGAESFDDSNGNAVFDAGDSGWTDLPEAYADENQNGIYDIDEFYVENDDGVDGVRDGPNGSWDGPCLDSVDPSALCDGLDLITISRTSTIVMPTNSARLHDAGTFGAAGTTITVQQGTIVSRGGIEISDSNANADALGGNPMPLGTTIQFSLDGGGASLSGTTSWTVKSGTGPTGFYGATISADAVDPADPLPAPMPRLLLTVTAPDGTPTEFAWPLNITR